MSEFFQSVVVYVGRAIPGCVVATIVWLVARQIRNPRIRLTLAAVLMGVAVAPTKDEGATTLVTPASWLLGISLKDMCGGLPGFLKEGGLQFLVIHVIFPIAASSLASSIALRLLHSSSNRSSDERSL